MRGHAVIGKYSMTVTFTTMKDYLTMTALPKVSYSSYTTEIYQH